MSNLFDTPESTTPEQATAPAPAVQIPDEVSDLIGPGKKYADPATALKALKHAQEHIARIEGENGQLRELAQKAEKVDETYKLVQDLLNKPPTQAASLDVTAVASLVKSQIQEVEQQRIAERNKAVFETSFVQAFGDKAKETLAAKAAELGLGKDYIADLAKRSPDAALKLFDLKSQATPAPKSFTGSVNTDALPPKPIGQPPRKNIMQGADTKEVVEAWRRAYPKD